MKCTNTVTQYVPRGYDYKAVESPCGSTGIHGERLQCESCERDPVKQEEHKRIMDDADHDNAWLASAGWGEA